MGGFDVRSDVVYGSLVVAVEVCVAVIRLHKPSGVGPDVDIPDYSVVDC